MQPSPSDERLPSGGVCSNSAARETRSLSSLWRSNGRSCGSSAKPHYSQRAPRMTYRRGVLDPAPNGTNDCSAFVSSIIYSSGLRVTPKQSNFVAFTTANMISWGEGGDCFKVGRFTENSSVVPGDVIVARRHGVGHVVMVDRVGEDPFGLRKIASVNDCKREPNFRDWDFTLTESTAKRASGIKIGPSIWDAKKSFSYSARGGNNHSARVFVDLWRSACEAKFGKPRALKFQNGTYKSRLIRHAGNSVVGCTNPNPPELKNQDCVKSCNL